MKVIKFISKGAGCIMKIEVGESLILSWLKHIKMCKLVQMNWKASNGWELQHSNVLEQLMYQSHRLFQTKYGYDLYKKNSGIGQMLKQAEIDVVGINFSGNENHIYAVDVAFHEFGLNYGSKDETIARVVKKIIRTVMCIYGYFHYKTATIIFTAPKVNPAVLTDLNKCMNDIQNVLHGFDLHYNIQIIANDEFNKKILTPVLEVMDYVSDTSELFIRSLQMYNLFSDKVQRKLKTHTPSSNVNTTKEQILTDDNNFDELKDMKIGIIAKTVLRKILEDGKISPEEIELMQSKNYSKKNFDIQYPLLQKVSLTNEIRPERYYSFKVRIHEEEYFLCSQWYESDRPFLMKWLILHK